MTTNKYYWTSFYVPNGTMKLFELHSPWWVSGWDTNDDTIIVAAIRAENEELAWARVTQSFDSPVDYRQRFCERVTDRPAPWSDRFRQVEWMAWTDDATCACVLSTCDGKELS